MSVARTTPTATVRMTLPSYRERCLLPFVLHAAEAKTLAARTMIRAMDDDMMIERSTSPFFLMVCVKCAPYPAATSFGRCSPAPNTASTCDGGGCRDFDEKERRARRRFSFVGQYLGTDNKPHKIHLKTHRVARYVIELYRTRYSYG